MNDTPANTVIDDPIATEVPIEDTIRTMHMAYGRLHREESRKNEVALKGLYVDWAFDKLNLIQYR
jgi:hypothetical protein